MGVTVLLGAWLTACYAWDSATSACQRTPAYCATLAGEESVVPLVRGGAEVASLSAVHRLLSRDTLSHVEEALVACAESANAEVNLQHFGGQSPSRPQCQEVLHVDPCGVSVTRAMRLGQEKHHLALLCAQEQLGALIPGRFALEPRYRQDPATGRTHLVSEQEARRLLQTGCGEDIKGTLRPDVVLHSGDPLLVQAVYDFKFPCPSTNEPFWREYIEGPHQGAHQGAVYARRLQTEAALISPRWGVHRRVRRP
ncbi:hypothetical protein [Archangium primigenium]|uniref:hypothetical protein n=1 Tax=[Archangium] primigenium TaxID=2792470 RepID=UPI00195E1246|nr:hypothetical protein [Archangium primigenium]MBM7112926.1 hypothetical protein [Archangium primigenium]